MTNCPPETILRMIGTDAVGEATFAGLESTRRAVSRLPEGAGSRDEGRPASDPPRAGQGAPAELPGLDIERELDRGGRAWFTSPGTRS